MHDLDDGLYQPQRRHDDVGHRRRGDPPFAAPVPVSWGNVLGVRQIGGKPGYVQLLVRDHVPGGHSPTTSGRSRSAASPTPTGC